ncbi:alpha/beta hydrolase [Bizionia myxarmorum]|uniref:Alpha/beta hydrolase n=2 Tax=Bizionia myxarmorum TaxID=291186 RepID=A0A5D0RFJ1_9FLAO|nr:alpha/beta hydrolase [Bizionia myxarmorum]
MKTIQSLFFYSFAFLLIFSCQSDDDALSQPGLDATTYYQELNVSYGPDGDQKYDIYLPANRNMDTNVMILIHGGGWSAGDKAEMNEVKDALLNEFPNMGIVNMNYRLADAENGPYPMQLNDITTVINKLKSDQNYYVIDNDFGFIGTSAGGHLALLWSYAFDISSDVSMVCSIVGPTNLADPFYLESDIPEIQGLIALFVMDASVAYLEEVSPLNRVTASAPPTLLFYGGVDPLVPVSQGTDLHNKLDNLGVTNEFTLYPNGGHGWIGPDLVDTTVKLKAFIQTHFN